MNPILPETQQAILEGMLNVWRNTVFQTEIELKIQGQLKKTLGRDVTEAERTLLERLRDCEIAIQTIQTELSAVIAVDNNV